MVVLIVSLLAAACDGGEGGDSPTTAAGGAANGATTTSTAGGNPDTTADGAQPADPPGGSGDGWIEVDGARADLVLTFRCEPSLDPDHDIDFPGFRGGAFEYGDGQGHGIDVEVFFDSSGTADGVWVNYMIDVTEEQYDGSASLLSQAWDEPGFAFTLSGNRLTGGPLAVYQSWPEDGDNTHTVSWDFTIPSETQDC